jgi:hypothetical protein
VVKKAKKIDESKWRVCPEELIELLMAFQISLSL